MTKQIAECATGEVLIGELETFFGTYAALDNRLPFVLACWSIATHIFESFDSFPYLAVTSPTKRCGKTRLSELLEFVCATPLRTVGITAPALFRLVHSRKPTLIIDEAEALRTRDERAGAVREILNAGYRKGQKVWRCNDAKGYEPQSFDTYCPKVLVLIGNLPDTVSDRCIPITMHRRTNEHVHRFRYSRAQKESEPLRVQIGRWVKANAKSVGAWYEETELHFLQDREEELWLVIFAVAAIAAPQRLVELERTAIGIARSKVSAVTNDWSCKLLADLKEAFESTGKDRLSTVELLRELNSHDESPWPTWMNGQPLNSRGVASVLRPFGIYSQNLRADTAVLKGYLKTSFKEAWERYL